jgi:hypothetical protein
MWRLEGTTGAGHTVQTVEGTFRLMPG